MYIWFLVFYYNTVQHVVLPLVAKSWFRASLIVLCSCTNKIYIPFTEQAFSNVLHVWCYQTRLTVVTGRALSAMAAGMHASS